MIKIIKKKLSKIFNFQDLFPSPSKMFFLRLLKRDLETHSLGYKIGLDAASANMKYKHHFKTTHYIGVDLDKESLIRGVGKKGGYAVHLNMLELGDKKELVDFILSSHTLANFTEDKDKIKVIKKLITTLKQNGNFIFNVPYDKKLINSIDEILGESFGDVKKIRYGHPLFKKFGEFMSDKTSVNNIFKMFLMSIIILFSWLLSFLENFGFIRRKGFYIYYLCLHKNTTTESIDSILKKDKENKSLHTFS